MALTWRKASRSAGGSGNSGDCVEVAFGLAGPLLRDSMAFVALINSVKL